MQTGEHIYLDNAATTKVDEFVAAEALRVMCEDYGNPSSLHALGLRAEGLMQAAEAQILSALGAGAGRLIFTGSGTEASNLAILGGAAAKARRGGHMVTTAIEHSAVLEPMRALRRQGCELTLVEPERDGRVTPEAVAGALREDTVVVSVMAVNNETGAQQDIAAMAPLVRARSPHALFHCDAVQAFGKIPLSVDGWGVDMLSISGHKLYAPKGVGALYLAPGVRIEPVLFGGGQGRGLRPGTESLPLIHAFGAAAGMARTGLKENVARVSALRDQFLRGLADMGDVPVHSPEGGSPYIVNFSLPGYRSEVVLHFLERHGIYVSSGSACGRGRASHVLEAMGLDRRAVDSALRVSFSKWTTEDHVAALLHALISARKQLIKAR